MQLVPVSVGIDYARPRSCEEVVLSCLSWYYNLGGRYVVVIKANQVRFEESQVSCLEIAAKVASYLILFPLTVPLFIVNLGLRYRHEFSLFVPSKVKKKIKKRILPFPKQEASLVKAAEKAVLPIVDAAEKGSPYLYFQIKDNDCCTMYSEEEMLAKAKDLAQQVERDHSFIVIVFPDLKMKSAATEFALELSRIGEDVVAKPKNPTVFYIGPRKIGREQGGRRDNTIIYRYANGVVEMVDQKYEGWGNWKGLRIFPKGVTERGSFCDGLLYRGERRKEGITIAYRNPDILLPNDRNQNGFMYLQEGAERRLIGICKKPDGEEGDYMQIEQDLMQVLALRLRQCVWEDQSEQLREVLSGPVDCKKFIEFLFQTRAIVSLSYVSMEVLLKIIQKKGLLDPFREQLREKRSLFRSNRTLLEQIEKFLAKQEKKPVSPSPRELSRGRCVEEESTLYRNPKRILLGSFIYIKNGKGKELIAVDKTPEGNYRKAEGSLMSVLASQLKEGLDTDRKKSDLQEILSGPVDCAKFIQFLFHKEDFFDLAPSSLAVFLPIIKQKGLLDYLAEQFAQEETIDIKYSNKQLQEILSGPINCEEFIPFLIETKQILRLDASTLYDLLMVLKDMGQLDQFRHPLAEFFTKENPPFLRKGEGYAFNNFYAWEVRKLLFPNP